MAPAPMKRSVIDGTIEDALAEAARYRFALPGFATWGREEWLSRAEELAPTAERGLGWDVTDFGRGDFASVGLCLCTLRNGSLAERDSGHGQTYAEKVMFVGVGQETPFHKHERKAEDIINRGGGTLVLELRSDADGTLGEEPVRTFVDGVVREVTATERVSLAAGQSIHIAPGVFHRFWAEGSRVFAAEVSSVNDDAGDNTFLDPFPRYAVIEEDAEARFLLVSEYSEKLSPLI